MARSTHALLLLAVAAVAAASCFSPAAAGVAVADVCKGTPYAELCTATSGKQASRYPTVDALTVLSMQVDAFSKRAAAARLHAAEMSASPTVAPGAARALKTCDGLYSDVEDNLGAARRAIGFKDAVTIRAMMGMAAQDMKNCDEEFRKEAAENPLTRFDKSLLDISENCRALSNMI
jgi:pectinesterase inhibitor-like protein